MKKYDYLIVGAGLFGAVFAHEATKKGKTCLVIDKRDHIGGNIYTEEVEGIQVHKYGAHIFHTSKKEIWDYVNQFAEFNNYINLRFTRLESNLMARIIPGDEPSNIGTEENVTRSLEQNTNPGIWQSMKIMAYTPDSSAMVVDITKILVDHSDYTSPFAAFGGNSMGGFTQRQHQFRSNMTRLLGVNAFDNNVVVTGEYSYSVNHTFMGTQP